MILNIFPKIVMVLFIVVTFICFGLTEANYSYKFPDNFLLGFSTASYQIEGAWNEDGKGENIWDRLVHTQPSAVEDRSNGDVACDSYHKYKEDVELLTHIGAGIYRFSISWARIFPRGDIYKINKAGVDYYNNLINALLEKKIQPMVTLYHWDLPQQLQNLGGWTNPVLVDYFEDYARFVFQQFGDRVKWWITFNEPLEICQSGYGGVNQAPVLNMTGRADYLCAHTILKSHARAYHVYREEFKKSQKGNISITLNGGWNEPLTNSTADKEAAERSLEFQIGWFLHPILKGDYPPVMRKRIDARSNVRSRLPYFNKNWITYINGTIDYLGINHYTTYLVTSSKNKSTDPSYQSDIGVQFSQNSSWPGSTVSWLKVEPKGFRKKLQWLKNYTNNFPIFITENGYADNGELKDWTRINYYYLYLKELLKAIHLDSCNIIGYSAWSLIDNFEWLSGYKVKFGVCLVDFDNPNRPRTPKTSANFFRSLLRTKTLQFYQNFQNEGLKEQLLENNRAYTF